MGAFRSGWRRIGVLIGIVGLVAVTVASPASAHDDDTNYYTVDIAGAVARDTYAGDSNAQITITVKNLSRSQRLGSANITVPAPFTLVSAPGDTVPGNQIIELRSLNLAKDATKTVVATVDVRTCVATAPVAFPTVAKKTSDHSGSSVFTLKAPYDTQVGATGTCSLAFVTQPTDAEKNVAITGNFGAAPPISVQVRDAGGTDTATFSVAPISLTAANAGLAGPITLGGTTSANAAAGVATFSPGPSLAVSAFNYTLTAASPGLTSSAPSTPFAIADDVVPCPAGGSCTATAAKSGTTATATFGGGAATNLTVSVGAADAPTFECNNYPKGSSQVSQFVFTGGGGGDRTGTFSVTIPNASWFVILYQVCWASPVDFITKSGKLASVVADVGDGTPKPGTPGQTLKVGLLPNCKKWWWNDHWDWDEHWDFPNPTIETLPCVSSRSYNWSTRSVTIEVKATGADPWRY